MSYSIYTGAGLGGSTFGNVTLASTNTSYTYTMPANPLNTVLSVSGGGASGSWTNGASVAKPALKVTGDADFDGNITVQGKNITEALDAIEQRLGIMRPNTALEKEFDELKALGDAYREAEKRFTEQKRVFEILKKQDE